MRVIQILLFLLGCDRLFCNNFKNFGALWYDNPYFWNYRIPWEWRSLQYYGLPKRPHIVFMLIDDLGWNDVSFHGSKQIPTPNVDAIARDGVILNQYYVQSICSPSRGALMTGKYPMQIGFQHWVIQAAEPWGLPLKEKIFPQYFKSLGYKTHAVGKWHLGFFKKEYLPQSRGFDTFFGYYNGLEDYFTHVSISHDLQGYDLHENGETVYGFNGTYGTDMFTAKAKQIITEHDPNQPLFLYIAQQSVHSGNFEDPFQCPQKYYKPMVGIENEKRKIFSGMVSAMDKSVGDIFSTLDRAGMLDDTIFIFSTDNGGITQQHAEASGSNYPLKGSKYTLWEGGTRGTSFIWSSSLRLRSRIHNGLMHITDWLPTLLYAAGGSEALSLLPEGIDGINQWPSISQSLPSPRSEILLNLDDEGGVAGLRRGRFKMVKGTYQNGDFDKWFDREGRPFDVSYSIRTPAQEMQYEANYERYLRRSKVARILLRKYGKNPRLTSSCITLDCKRQLEVQCGVPPPPNGTASCDAVNKEACLFDILNDPCEFYNIAKQLPTVTADMLSATDKYRKSAVPSGLKPADPNADPKLRGNVWLPWK